MRSYDLLAHRSQIAPNFGPKLVGRRALSATHVIRMVTRARFERATPSFGGWCSIQLSYRANPWWDVLDSNQ